MADDPIKLGMVAHGDNPSTGRLSQGTELEASLGKTLSLKTDRNGGGWVQF